VAGPRALPTPVVVRFDVEGRPAPKGSLSRLSSGRYVESSKHLRPWMAAVTAAATVQRLRLGRAMCGPISLDVVVRVAMPKVRSSTGATRLPATSLRHGDWDKHARAISDALVRAGLLDDDRWIVSGRVAMFEVVEWTGAEIDVEEVS
jgi:crossover junction endodeoxyribonuclease RusA